VKSKYRDLYLLVFRESKYGPIVDRVDWYESMWFRGVYITDYSWIREYLIEP
jgi:hypothetical protein